MFSPISDKAEQPPPRERTRLARGVVQRLLDEIRNHRFEIGSRLPAERTMAQALGVSRPIVREALVALELLGIVETRLGSGTYVIGSATVGTLNNGAPSPFEVVDTLRVLENEALSKVMRSERADAAFHLAEVALGKLLDTTGDFELWHRTLATLHTSLAAAAQHHLLIDLINQLWQTRCEDHAIKALVEKSWRTGQLQPESDLGKALAALRQFDTEGAQAAIEATHRCTLSALIDVHRVTEMRRTELATRELRERFGVRINEHDHQCAGALSNARKIDDCSGR